MLHAGRTTDQLCLLPERFILSIAAAVIFFVPGPLFAQPDSRGLPDKVQQYKIASTEGDISIDGVLDERG